MLTKRDVVRRLRAAIESADSLNAFARKHGISPAYVSKVARGEQTPGPKIAKELGLRHVEGWVER